MSSEVDLEEVGRVEDGAMVMCFSQRYVFW